MLMTPVRAAAETAAAASQPAIVDVALDSRQQLHGQLLSRSGEPVSGARIGLQQRGELLSQTTTDAEGRFQFIVARGGVYELADDGQITHVRLWTAHAAPPNSIRQLVVAQGDVLRGQSGRIPYTQVNPWLVAGVIAVAVAIPVVLANNRSDRGDGS
jgi:hypothetical protein